MQLASWVVFFLSLEMDKKAGKLKSGLGVGEASAALHSIHTPIPYVRLVAYFRTKIR